MSGAMKQGESISDLTGEELESVFGGTYEGQSVAGDSYVCTVKDNHIVVGSCVKVD